MSTAFAIVGLSQEKIEKVDDLYIILALGLPTAFNFSDRCSLPYLRASLDLLVTVIFLQNTHATRSTLEIPTSPISIVSSIFSTQPPLHPCFLPIFVVGRWWRWHKFESCTEENWEIEGGRLEVKNKKIILCGYVTDSIVRKNKCMINDGWYLYFNIYNINLLSS